MRYFAYIKHYKAANETVRKDVNDDSKNEISHSFMENHRDSLQMNSFERG